jgi:hypothetical protein
MKIAAVLFIVSGIGLAFNIDEADYSVVHNPQSPTDDIVLTPVNTWILSGVKTPRGIDCSDTAGELFITDYTADKIFILDYSGNSLGYIDVPAGLDDVGGICSGSDYLLINEMGSDTDIWEYHSTSWNPDVSNPSSNPMGLDMDADGNLWEIENSSNILYRFNSSGTVLNQWNLTEVPASASAMACTIFPVSGTNVLMVGGLTWSNFYFYTWDGSDLTYLGLHPVPESCNKSYGAAWCQQRDTIFWIYKTGGDFGVCEFQCFITGVALERSTWGGIKAGL